MNLTIRAKLLLGTSSAVLAAVLLAACAPMTMSTPMLVNNLSYPVSPSRTRVEATVVMKVSFTLAPEAREVWRRYSLSDESIANYEQAVVTVIANDVRAAGIFTNLVPTSASPDFVLTISSELLAKPTTVLRIHYDIVNASAQRISGRTLEVPIAENIRNADLKRYLPGAMQQVRDAVVKDIVAYFQMRRDAKDREQAEALHTAKLEDLLASSDRSVGTARERNRALIAAKNEQLPKMLREWKTEQLGSLVVKIEQAILDLNHEAEVANDHAQQATAAGGPASDVDVLRGLAISYRERIELLKPILAAVRDEIANRNR